MHCNRSDFSTDVVQAHIAPQVSRASGSKVCECNICINSAHSIQRQNLQNIFEINKNYVIWVFDNNTLSVSDASLRDGMVCLMSHASTHSSKLYLATCLVSPISFNQPETPISLAVGFCFCFTRHIPFFQCSYSKYLQVFD